MRRRRSTDIGLMSPARGSFIVGNRMLAVERGGRSVVLGEGEPFPEAASLPPRRLKLLVDRGDVIFLPKGGLSRDSVVRLVLGLTKASFTELTTALELEMPEGAGREQGAELVADALLEAEAFAEVEKIQAIFSLQREPKVRPVAEEKAPEDAPAPSLPDPADWPGLKAEELELRFAEAPELEVEAAMKAAGLMAQVLARLQETQHLARRGKIERMDTFREAALHVVRERVFGVTPPPSEAEPSA